MAGAHAQRGKAAVYAGLPLTETKRSDSPTPTRARGVSWPKTKGLTHRLKGGPLRATGWLPSTDAAPRRLDLLGQGSRGFSISQAMTTSFRAVATTAIL